MQKMNTYDSIPHRKESRFVFGVEPAENKRYPRVAIMDDGRYGIETSEGSFALSVAGNALKYGTRRAARHDLNRFFHYMQ